jgi:hypothetical protein
VTEAQATLCAVEFSRDMGLKNIILKGDSLQVVNALKVKCPTTQIGIDMSNWWPMHKLSLLLRRWWQSCHNRRVENYAAYDLTKAAVKQTID